MTAQQPTGGLLPDLRYLIRTLPPGTTRLLWIYCVLQFLISLLDLVGLAAVMPVMQVLSGADLSSGYLGQLHRAFGQPARSSFAVMLCALMVTAFAAKSVFALIASRWSLGFVMRLQIGTARKLLQSYLRESYLVQRRQDVGAVVRTVGTAVNAAHTGVLGGVLSLFAQLLSVFFIVAFLAVVAPGTTLVAGVYFAVVILVIQRVLGRKNREAGRVAQATSATMSHAMLEAIYGAREIRMHAAEEYFVEDFTRAARVNGVASRDANFYAQAPKYLLEFATIAGIGLLLASAASSGNTKDLMPVLTIFVAAAVKLMPTMTALTVTIGSVRFGQEGLRVTVEALQRLEEHGENSVTNPASRPTEHEEAKNEAVSEELVVSDLSFRYPDASSSVLQSIDFTVPAGTSLAICGVSGSGKTTLVDIVLGLIPPVTGGVRCGDVDVQRDHARWLEKVAYVPQNVYLLAATLWQNVAFGIPEEHVDRERVVECLRWAQLGELMDQFPEGIDAVIGFEGAQISGGQKQRIGIARALYRDPSVLVLDEATSALDNETEDRIGQVLRELHGRVTTVLVAHRLSTVRHVDQLLFLEKGRIASRGTFDEVSHENPEFARLVQLGRLDDEESPE